VAVGGLSGTGLDVNSLVSQLMAAERAPIMQRFSSQESVVTTRLSAFSTLKNAVSAISGALTNLSSSSVLAGRVATSADPTIYRASATGDASLGSHSVTVSNLAVAQKLASPEYAQGASYVPSNSPGTLTFTQNGVSFTISDTQGKTLAELRDAINAAPDNTGVTASIMNTGGGARLILSADQTGLANAITVSGTGNINQFANDLTELIPAEDASAVIDGIPITSSTNTLTGIIDGVTITLLKESATPVGMTVAYDAVGAKDKITKLVTDYNNFVDTAKKLRSYDTSSRAAGPLIGDSGLRNLEAALRREMTAVTPSAPVGMDSILALGFKFGNDGKLSVNETILADKLATDLDKITQIFSATDGLAARLKAVVDPQIAADGLIAVKTNTLNDRKRNIQASKEAAEARLAVIEKRYRAQFVALDRMLAEMQGTSSYVSKLSAQK
jgi:flagellar hook-associated protein 2